MIIYKHNKFNERIGEEKLNNQGCLMKVIEYNDVHNIVVEFQDDYKAKIHTSWHWFLMGGIKNPYHPSVFGVGIIGTKYPITINGKITKEYNVWHSMLQRCFDKELKEKYPVYQDVICCDEWLLYENFYEWLCSQSNFDRWMIDDKWAVDKDILIKGNKEYNPNTCCLVPMNVNNLFTNRKSKRGKYPIGVSKNKNLFMARCRNLLTDKLEYIGTNYKNPIDAFYAYKKRKEEIIKQVAEMELSKGNISKQCYEAMMNYEVEITD